MQTANMELRLSKIGNTIPKRNVTPIEYAILRFEHGGNAGGPIIVEGTFEPLAAKQVVQSRTAVLDYKGEVKLDAIGQPVFKIVPRDITPLEELALLRRKYKPSTIAKLYPGENPTNLPADFAAVGVDAKGNEKAAQEAEKVEVIGPEGVVEVIPVAVAGPRVAPVSDGVSRPTGERPDPRADVERRPGTPENLAFATGATRDDGGRAPV